jgi:hypothetical protein
MPIHCFAIFAAVVLLIDYVFMILFGPTVMMLYHVHLSDLGGCCCVCGKNFKGFFGAQEPEVSSDSKTLRDKDQCYKGCCYSKWPQDQAMVDVYVAEQVYVCMYVCIHTHTFIYIYIHTHTYTHTYIHTYTHTHTHTNKHTYIHTYTHTHTHTHTCIYIYTYIC